MMESNGGYYKPTYQEDFLDMPFPDMERVHSGGQRDRWMQVRCVRV